MPVDSTRPEYQEALYNWKLCEDLSKGERAIKEAGREYLPELGGQSSTQYQAYKKRGVFFNAFGRTKTGFNGGVFRKVPAWEVPEKIEAYIENITDSGLTIIDLASQVIDLILEKGRCGLLVDKSLKDNSNPFITVCTPESIINWNSSFKEGREILNLIVLQEIIYEPNSKDKYEFIKVNQIRVFELVDGKCYSEVWKKYDGDDEHKMYGEPIPLLIHGKPIDYIPFVFIGAERNTSEITNPPLLDLANVNIDHWRLTVDYRHGLHYAALPTPVLAGFPIDDEYTIGPEKFLVSDDKDAKWGFLEFSGQGLEAVATAIESDERMMAVLGARIIEKTRDAIETAETARLRQAGEESTLVKIVNGSSRGITTALQLIARWESLPEDGIYFKLNTDFVGVHISPQQITALMQAYQGGGISHDTFIYNMVEGEITPPDVTLEEEKELIEVMDMGEFTNKNQGVQVVKKNTTTKNIGAPVDKSSGIYSNSQ